MPHAKKTIFKIFLLLVVVFGIVYADPIRIMPLGDSITYDNNYADGDNPRPTGKLHAYRNYLYYKLQAAGYDADFVGSVNAGADVTPKFDPDNEGHPGWSSFRIADHTYEFLENNPADIVLIHAGTNDHHSNVRGMENMLSWIDFIEVDQKKKVTVVLALIIQRNVFNSTNSEFNVNLRKLANERISKGDSIIVVDMEHDAGLKASDYADYTHPNDHGYNKMAAIWAKALLELGRPEDDPELREYPYTILDAEYLYNVYVNTETKSVTFKAKIPADGIKF